MSLASPALTHEWIWRAIDQLATRKGVTPSALARLASLDPTAFNKSKRFTSDGRPRWPSTESISKVLAATETSLDDFVELATVRDIEQPRQEPVLSIAGVPVVGEIREAAVMGIFSPDMSASRTAPALDKSPAEPFALAVADESLEPAYSRGNVLFLSPREPSRTGDRVVVKVEGQQPIPSVLVASSPIRIDLAPFQRENRVLRLDRTTVEWIARIMWARQ